MSKSVVFILVHGTFAPRAPWTNHNSALCSAIFGIAPNAEIVAFQWTGANRFADRQEAAKRLEEKITSLLSLTPERAVFIIGHSHGGSLMSYVLQENPALAHRLAGVAFLSVPFIIATIRRKAEAIVEMIQWALVAAMILVSCSIFGFMIWRFVSHGNSTQGIKLIMYGAIAFGLFIFRQLTEAMESGAEVLQRVDQYCKKISSNELPTGNYLFMRMVGDEATALLASLQFANNLIGRLSAAVALVWGLVGSAFSLLLGWIPFVGVILEIFSGFLVVGALMATSLTFGYLLNDWSTSNDSFWAVIKFELWNYFDPLRVDPIEALMAAVMFSCLALPVLATLSLLTWLLLCLLAYPSYFAYGKMSFLSALTLEVNVEATPLGTQTIHVFSQAAANAGIFSLSHSHIYDSPTANQELQAWIRNSLQTQGGLT